MISTEDLPTLLNNGGVVIDQSGDKIGKIGQVYLDDASGNPEWVTAKTGLFGGSETFIPIRDASASGTEVTVPYSTDKIKDAPRMDDADGHLSPEQEQELYRYYGLSTGDSDTSGRNGDSDVTSTDPAYAKDQGFGDDGHDTSGPDTDDAMTRSEEQVRVGTEKVATGKALLRKYVVTEEVTETVPVKREKVHVEREPITDANRDKAMAGGDITEEVHEVVLNEERVVVDKETVPVERVRMDTETVTEQQEVTEQVRKEQIEADLPDDQSSSTQQR